MSSLSNLQLRARMLAEIRRHFANESTAALEVQTSRLSTDPPSRETLCIDGQHLVTYSEREMRALIAQHWCDLYQIAPVFRNENASSVHLPQFTMLEWFRVGQTLEELQSEALALITRLFQVAGRTLAAPQIWEWRGFWSKQLAPGRPMLGEMINMTEEETRNLLLQIYLDEACTSDDSLLVLRHLPICTDDPSAADHDHRYSERFEIFYRGAELLNGYLDNTDPEQVKQRWPEAPDLWLKVVATAPPTADAGLGLERVLMAATGAAHIREVT